MSNPLPSSAQAAHFLKTAERQRTQDWLFHRLTQAFSLLVLLALAGIIVSLFINAWPTFAKFGARFIWYVEWDIINEEFGAAIDIVGTVASAGLSAIIKKNKRTLVNFQEQFLIPFVKKSAYRFMQFDPENYPAKDFNFIASSNLGIIAREYEQMQFMNLLKTLGPDSPVVPIVLNVHKIAAWIWVGLKCDWRIKMLC